MNRITNDNALAGYGRAAQPIDDPMTNLLKRFSVRSLLLTVALIAVLLGLSVPAYRWLNQDHFIIVVTNERTETLGDVTLTGLGPDGELGLLQPQETKFVVMNDSTFQKYCSLVWIEPSGIETGTGRLWEAGSNANGKIFKLSVKRGGGVQSDGGSDATLSQRLKYRD